jgi:hypothetical protein
MDVNELEHLERQVDASLRQIRSTKARSMLDQLSDLKTKEEMLLETNRDLRRKVAIGIFYRKKLKPFVI